MNLEVLQPAFSVCRLPVDTSVPAWAFEGSFFNICRTSEELSIVVETTVCPADIQQENGWHALKVAGPLDFSLTGILASLVQPLAEAGISIFAVSTYDTDYLLVKAENLELARKVLENAGHRFMN